MVYIMDFKVDGGCRGNGQSGAIGAAAVILLSKWGDKYNYKTKVLDRYPTPTNQRAEILAIIMALKWALERYDELDTYPFLQVEIRSDSKYAVNCMNQWIYKWSQNGWTNSAGNEVANSDLIREASRLDDRVAALGKVSYVWIPREENEEADSLCNKAMDEISDDEWSSSSW
jgi:ribonuclease HI